MLSYMGNKQPPRQFPLSRHASPILTDGPSTCSHCATSVFSGTLTASLIAAWEEKQDTFNYSYERSSQDLRKSCFDGCKWCKGLVNGILTFVHLESVYEKWNHSSSGGFSDDMDLRDGQEDLTGHTDNVRELSTPSDEGSDNENDPIGVFDTFGEQNILNHESSFRVELSFQRSGSSYFCKLDVQIELIEIDEVNVLRDLLYDKVVNLTYHVHGVGTLGDHVLAPLKTDFKLCTEENFHAASLWINKCQRARPEHDIDHEKFIPTRLIHVTSHKGLCLTRGSEIVSCRTNASKMPDYVSLSYAWGVTQTLVLTKNSMDELMLRIDEGKLPQTIIDAIYVTRRLGFDYLWIDALCIIQDSEVDKATELSKMRLVYQEAALTIVAANASSAVDGFLAAGQPPSYLIEPFEIQLYSRNGQLDGMSLSYPANYKRWRDAINDRAWTLQELLLSQYALIYSYNGLQMVERTSTSFVNSPRDDSGPPVMARLTWNTPLFTLGGDLRTLRQLWLAVRDEYSRRQLTYGKDKLIAIAAVAEEIGNFQGEYVAGLWVNDLTLDLQWRRPDRDNDGSEESRLHLRPSYYRAPSWSWASIDGEVGVYEEEDIQELFHFQVKSWIVELLDPAFPYGAVCGAKLEAEGLLHTFIWRPTSDPITDQCDGFLVVKAEGDGQHDYNVGEATLDALEPGLISEALVDCLAMTLVERIPGRVEVEGLMLLPVDEISHRRIGFFKTYGQIIFEAVKPSRVTIR